MSSSCFPVARQDRVMIPGEPLSVKIYADIVNQLDFQKVTILDAHSDVAPALINNCEAVPNHAFIREVMKQVDINSLVSPDGGALKKIYQLSAYLGGGRPNAAGNKEQFENVIMWGMWKYENEPQGTTARSITIIYFGIPASLWF